MSEIDDMLEQKSKRKDKTFSEVEGLPANAHKRTKIREEKAANKTKEAKRKVFFTMNGNKFVRIDVKPNGAYMTYLGRMRTGLGAQEARLEKEKWDLEKKKWLEKGPWLHPHESEEKIHEALEELRG